MAWVSREDEQPAVDDCVFCELPAASADREHRILLRGTRAYVVMNRSPYMTGHLMVLPYEHTDEYHTLSEETLLEMSRLEQQATLGLERTLSPDGFNIGMNLGTAGGASVTDHLHVHVVPRWDGDVSFMQMTGDTSVIVEALDETYTRLHEAVAELDAVTPGDAEEAHRLDASG